MCLYNIRTTLLLPPTCPLFCTLKAFLYNYVYVTGNILNIIHHLNSQLSKAKSRLKKKENAMADANCLEWRKCQQPWQNEQALIFKYFSAIMRLIGGAIYSMNKFHESGLLHLDIKGMYIYKITPIMQLL